MNKSTKPVIRDFPPTDRAIQLYTKLGLPVASTVSFIATVVLAALNNSAGAAVTGALFLGTLVFSQLPKFTSFKLFGLEAQLKETIKEADEAIDRLTDLAKLFSKQAYTQIAYSGWIEGIPRSDRPRLVAEIDISLREAGLSDSQIIEIRKSINAVAMYCLAHIFTEALNGRIQKITNALNKEVSAIQKLGPIDMREPSGKRYDELVKRIQQIATAKPRLKGSLDPRLMDPAFRLASLIPSGVLDDAEYQKLVEASHRIDDLIAEARGSAGASEAVDRFIAEYDRTDLLSKELFSETSA